VGERRERRPAAPTEAGRGGLRPGGVPAWQGGRGGAGRLGRPRGCCGTARTGRTSESRGALGCRRVGRPPACSGLQDRRCAGFIGGRGSGAGRGSAGKLTDDRAVPVRRRAGKLGTDRWSVVRSRPDSARCEEEGGELRGRLGTRVASGNGPREGARGSDAEAARAGALDRGDVAPAWKCFGLALFKRGFLQKFE
jgi:hypothetical protein